MELELGPRKLMDHSDSKRTTLPFCANKGAALAREGSKLAVSSIFTRERSFVTEQFEALGLPSDHLEDQVQDFFLFFLEWARRNNKELVTRDELLGRVDVYLRGHRRKLPQPAQFVWECLESHPELLRGSERTVDLDFEKAIIDREQVVRFLHCMTEKSQLAVIVYYLVGLTREEMADIWGVSANTVATQAFRGIRQARSFGPRLPLEEHDALTSCSNQRVDLPMEWGSIPLDLSERSAHLVCPWYDPQRARQRWIRRTPFGAPERPVMLWPQPTPQGRRGNRARRRSTGNSPYPRF